MTQQQAENATKCLHTKHFNELEPFLSNRLKQKLRPPQDTHASFVLFNFFITTLKFGNYDTATDRKCYKMVTHQKL